MENILKFSPFNKQHLHEYTYSKEIIKKGYAFIDLNTFQEIQKNNNFHDVNEQDVSDFIDSWNALDLDQFMSDKGKYRTRKHATLLLMISIKFY